MNRKPPVQDPVLSALAEISLKLDTLIAKQEKTNARLDQIHADCRRVARTNGAIAGGVSGALVSATIAYIRAKMGV